MSVTIETPLLFPPPTLLFFLHCLCVCLCRVRPRLRIFTNSVAHTSNRKKKRAARFLRCDTTHARTHAHQTQAPACPQLCTSLLQQAACSDSQAHACKLSGSTPMERYRRKKKKMRRTRTRHTEHMAWKNSHDVVLLSATWSVCVRGENKKRVRTCCGVCVCPILQKSHWKQDVHSVSLCFFVVCLSTTKKNVSVYFFFLSESREKKNFPELDSTHSRSTVNREGHRKWHAHMKCGQGRWKS